MACCNICKNTEIHGNETNLHITCCGCIGELSKYGECRVCTATSAQDLWDTLEPIVTRGYHLIVEYLSIELDTDPRKQQLEKYVEALRIQQFDLEAIAVSMTESEKLMGLQRYILRHKYLISDPQQLLKFHQSFEQI